MTQGLEVTDGEMSAQVPLDSPATAAREWRTVLADAAFRERAHGVVLMLVSVVAVSTGLLMVGPGSTLLGAGMGVYGLYLWRRGGVGRQP